MTGEHTTVRRSSRHSFNKLNDPSLLPSQILSTTKPSAKALGKRPERPHIEAQIATNDATTPLEDPGIKKATRVLPSRSSRRALGGGSSLVDELVLDAQQRAGLTPPLFWAFMDIAHVYLFLSLASNQPILRESAVFLLTTDSALVPPRKMEMTDHNPSVFSGTNIQPPVKEKSIIETPDFSILPESSAVGSRLRARGTEEVSRILKGSYPVNNENFFRS